MSGYQIFTDATADMSESMTFGWPSVRILPMQVHIGERNYQYGPHGDITVNEFYRLQRSGQFAMTSQASPDTCMRLFEPCLQEGKDIIYIGFSSALSGMYHSASLAAEELRQRYPERRIMCIDMSDQEIANRLNVVRSTVQYRRTSSLKEMRKRMEVVQDGKHSE